MEKEFTTIDRFEVDALQILFNTFNRKGDLINSFLSKREINDYHQEVLFGLLKIATKNHPAADNTYKSSIVATRNTED
jgi:hypothetical protein